jgi:outer membrane lipoprotein SlyB
MRLSYVASLAALGALCVGCAAQKPVLYPNERLNQVGMTVAERDRKACEEIGDEAVKNGTAGQVAAQAAKSGAIGAGAGAAGGAVWGAITGGVASGAAGGAAGGAVGGVLASLLGHAFNPPPPDPAYRAVVERCLRDRGYEVVGWQ